MFNMNNSEASEVVCGFLVRAAISAEHGEDGEVETWLALGKVLHGVEFVANESRVDNLLRLFNNAIAHAKAKKEQNQ